MGWLSVPHIAAYVALPLLALAAFFGFHHTAYAPVESSTPPVVVAPSTPPGTTPPPVSSEPTTTVQIVSVNPTSGPVGTEVTLGGDNFTSDNVIHFGGGAIGNVAAKPAVFNCPMMTASSTGNCAPFAQTLTFTIPGSIGPYCAPGTACPMYMLLVTPRTYDVYVTNANGTSNTVEFAVTAGNS